MIRGFILISLLVGFESSALSQITVIPGVEEVTPVFGQWDAIVVVEAENLHAMATLGGQSDQRRPGGGPHRDPNRHRTVELATGIPLLPLGPLFSAGPGRYFFAVPCMTSSEESFSHPSSLVGRKMPSTLRGTRLVRGSGS